MSSRFALAFASFFVLTAALTGCGQTRGETCQVDEDCEGDLICCKTTMTGPNARGTCETDDSCMVLGRVDAGGRDAQVPDAQVDASIDAEVDADVAEEDAGSDAGGEDAGPDEDAGSDAGSDSGIDSGTDAG